MAHEKIIEEVGNYYAEKVQVHGATPQGVDWNGEASQHLRFQQLCRIMGSNTAYSVLEYGSDFESALKRGVEEADNVLFLMSRSSLTSQYCQQEID